MAQRVLEFDWARTPLGPIRGWPQSLKSAVAICLHSRHQMALYWGPELNCIYNDAERDILGNLHPWALGCPAHELLRDSWPMVGPQLMAVMEHGEATWDEDRPLTFARRGLLEVGYFSYGYSPIVDDRGGVGGVLLVSHETTPRVLAERRMDTVREMGLRSMDAQTERQASRRAARALARGPDAAFALIYLIGEDGRARCDATAGLARVAKTARGRAHLDSATVARLMPQVRTRRRGRLMSAAEFVEGDATSRRPRLALVVPIAPGAAEGALGFIVAGIGDDLQLDTEYRRFLEMAALVAGRSIAAARQRRLERERSDSITALERAKTALYRDASHELRTPLALVLGHLEHVLDGLNFAEPARESLEAAHRGALRMLKLVNALLDFARIEAGTHLAAFAPTDLARLTCEIAAMFTSTVERAGLRLTVDCPRFSAPVYVDPEAWESIVSNLLSNALKFTPAGEIELSCREEQACALLTVRDTGIGIAEQDLDRVFSRFHRVEDSRARTHEGTGIGLALVRQLVKLHGGSVEAHSRPNQGTEMVVRIPLRPAQLAAHGSPADATAGGVGKSASLFIAEAEAWLRPEVSGPRPAASPLPGEPLTSRRHAEGRRVLVVEDNADMQGYLFRLLSPRYEVRIARNGAEAYELTVADAPQIVLSDVMMPGVGGLDLLRELRSNPGTRHLPVMLVSALADPGSAEEAFQLGADDYIVKPFSGRELLARVDATIESARSRSRAATEQGRSEERRRVQRELGALLNDLRAAQRRVVMAGDAERRKVERDLHDGAQQRLMAIRLELGLLADVAEQDPPAARAKLDALRGELDGALDELRELAHGLYPPLLESDGLRAALEAAARRAVIPITIEAAEFDRGPVAIESAAYFCCLEALQNAAKHAGAGARATVRLDIDGGVLLFRVDDDGCGFDPDVVRPGQGLTDLRDRVEALGGHADITSVPGEGTTVRGQIPVS
ncbi:MAG: response regulator [Solirubrobacterales bacterium]|nr:response regulator [Solirubrobacterales bacterium]